MKTKCSKRKGTTKQLVSTCYSTYHLTCKGEGYEVPNKRLHQEGGGGLSASSGLAAPHVARHIHASLTRASVAHLF